MSGTEPRAWLVPDMASPQGSTLACLLPSLQLLDLGSVLAHLSGGCVTCGFPLQRAHHLLCLLSVRLKIWKILQHPRAFELIHLIPLTILSLFNHPPFTDEETEAQSG